jgi:ubiquinone/menaquinone biosynthesis C-methylase UbiE
VYPTDVFSSKAEVYARYRWDYAPQAIQAILDVTGVSGASSVADIGAGTGILTRHFPGVVGQVYAVEPNDEMRQMAARVLGTHPSCHIVDGRAEATTLPDHSVDLIAVAQSIHWFDPQPTRVEFLRILKPGGWLAILRNRGTDDALGAALSEALSGHSGPDTAPSMVGRATPRRFYYGDDDYSEQTFCFTTRRTWEQFIGSLTTTSDAPDPGSARYAGFERAARRVFDRFSRRGMLESGAVTELALGRMR